jgi:hypothetical protein
MRHSCYSCGYYNSKCHYCNDLDVEVDDPGDPVCSEEYYNS